MIRAADWLRTYPDRLALVVTLELCGLTFIRGDLSKSNFIASSLFADGCGAVVMAGDSLKDNWARRISVESTSSVTWPDTLDIMGWQIVEKGLKVVFSRSIRQLSPKLHGRPFWISCTGKAWSRPTSLTSWPIQEGRRS